MGLVALRCRDGLGWCQLDLATVRLWQDGWDVRPGFSRDSALREEWEERRGAQGECVKVSGMGCVVWGGAHAVVVRLLLEAVRVGACGLLD
jgi:hypothetical protein